MPSTLWLRARHSTGERGRAPQARAWFPTSHSWALPFLSSPLALAEGLCPWPWLPGERWRGTGGGRKGRHSPWWWRACNDMGPGDKVPGAPTGMFQMWPLSQTGPPSSHCGHFPSLSPPGLEPGSSEEVAWVLVSPFRVGGVAVGSGELFFFPVSPGPQGPGFCGMVTAPSVPRGSGWGQWAVGSRGPGWA